MEVSQLMLARMYLCTFLAGVTGGLGLDIVSFFRRLIGIKGKSGKKRRGYRTIAGIVFFLLDFLLAVFCGICVILIRYFLNDGKRRPEIWLVFACGVFLWYIGPAHIVRPLLSCLADGVRHLLRQILKPIFAQIEAHAEAKRQAQKRTETENYGEKKKKQDKTKKQEKQEAKHEGRKRTKQGSGGTNQAGAA